METATLAGATILPPVPAYYHRPKSIDDLFEPDRRQGPRSVRDRARSLRALELEQKVVREDPQELIGALRGIPHYRRVGLDLPVHHDRATL